ncbi:MAG: endolytic transglycosylase MltG [Pseudonocardia sp.]|nr:endolytic transglycosylase MltG [Pseudonocardia sp.]MBO0877228.1 endolytic transglycosylase MltG [Pseudonocardia sp.]
MLLLVALLIAATGVGGYLGYQTLFGVPDFSGGGSGDVIVQINQGDPISAIGAELAREGVVQSAKAFTTAAAEDDARARSLQPGYYRLRLGMSGSRAVGLLLDPTSRVGQLEIKGGMQLDDTRLPDGTVTPGVLSLISKATCVELNGSSTCVTPDQLRTTMASTPPSDLGVPGWATAEVSKAEPKRRLEGLFAPGRYDIRPGSSPVEVLRTLVSESAAQYESLGLLPVADKSRYSAYQLLVIASMVEKEGLTQDFSKIARVIYNRLQDRVKLGLDSTVNYPLDLQEVRTSTEDRSRAGPYNSYLNYGLTPTPIGAPGDKAVQAALQPDPGPWMFFVRCHKDGTSCFATSLQEHQHNVQQALSSGAF